MKLYVLSLHGDDNLQKQAEEKTVLILNRNTEFETKTKVKVRIRYVEVQSKTFFSSTTMVASVFKPECWRTKAADPRALSLEQNDYMLSGEREGDEL